MEMDLGLYGSIPFLTVHSDICKDMLFHLFFWIIFWFKINVVEALKKCHKTFQSQQNDIIFMQWAP